jgi:uncharacterized membrane protein (DUF106 family)
VKTRSVLLIALIVAIGLTGTAVWLLVQRQAEAARIERNRRDMAEYDKEMAEFNQRSQEAVNRLQKR